MRGEITAKMVWEIVGISSDVIDSEDSAEFAARCVEVVRYLKGSYINSQWLSYIHKGDLFANEQQQEREKDKEQLMEVEKDVSFMASVNECFQKEKREVVELYKQLANREGVFRIINKHRRFEFRPTMAQLLTSVRLREHKAFCNFSEPGAGKTIAALLSSVVCACKVGWDTLSICFGLGNDGLINENKDCTNNSTCGHPQTYLGSPNPRYSRRPKHPFLNRLYLQQTAESQRQRPQNNIHTCQSRSSLESRQNRNSQFDSI